LGLSCSLAAGAFGGILAAFGAAARVCAEAASEEGFDFAEEGVAAEGTAEKLSGQQTMSRPTRPWTMKIEMTGEGTGPTTEGESPGFWSFRGSAS